MARSVYMCNQEELTTPKCSDCSEVKSRVAALEECCDEARATLSNHETRISGNTTAIQNIRNDLNNYYTKNQTYSRQEVLDLIGQIQTVQIVAVNELPQTGESNKIYLVPNGGTTPNIKDEYIWVNGAWELIGNTDIDLSNYVDTTTFNENMQRIADVDNDQCQRLDTLEDLLTITTDSMTMGTLFNPYTSVPPVVRRFGKVVDLTGSVTPKNAISVNDDTEFLIGTIPQDYAPVYNIYEVMQNTDLEV